MKIFFQILFTLLPLSIWAQTPILTLQNGHQSRIRYVAMAPNNAHFVSVDDAGTIILWDMTSGKQLRTFENGYAAEFSEDSRSIFIASPNGKFQQIDLLGKTLNNWVLENKVNFKSDNFNRWFFPQSGNLVTFWHLHNFKTGKSQRFNAQKTGVEQAYSPAKEIVGIGGESFLTLSDAINGQQIKEIPLSFPEKEKVRKVDFSRDGNLVLAGGKSIYNVIDVSKGTILQTFRHDEDILGATFSASGKEVIIGGVKNFYVWNVQSGSLIKKVKHDISVSIAPYSNQEIFKLNPNGRKIIIVDNAKDFKIYNAETLTLEKELNSLKSAQVREMFISNDAKILSAPAGSDLLIQWNLAKGIVEKTTKVPETGFYDHPVLTADGKTYFSTQSGGEIVATDAQSGMEKGVYEDEKNYTTSISRAKISFDGNYIAAVASKEEKGNLNVWSIPTKKLVLQKSATDATLAFGNKSNIAVIKPTWDSPMLKIINFTTGKELDNFSLGDEKVGKYYFDIKFSNNDKLIVSSEEKGFKITDLANKNNPIFCAIGKAIPNEFAFSSDDKYLFGGTREGEVFIFNTATGQAEGILKGHIGAIESIVSYKNGNFIFVKSKGDNKIKVWNVFRKELVATLYCLNIEGDWAVTCPDGRFDATQNAMKSMYFVKGLSVMPLENLFEKFYTPNLLPRILGGETFDPTPVDVNTLKEAPSVKISLENQQRNLTVDDDISTYTVDNEQVTIKVEADCPSDAVTEIRLFQNGKLVQTTRNLVVEDENTGEKTMTKTFSVVLVEGENRFKAIAFNTQRTESIPAEMALTYKKPKTSSSNSQNTEGGITLHLMVIGINKYKNPKYNLNYATADATSFKEAIEKGGTSIFSKTNVIFIGDVQATKEGISAELEKVKTTAKPQDVFIFYYAGHGVLNQKKDFFLVPHDVTQLYGNDDALAQKGLSANLLQQFSKEIKAQKQLFILDACQSAGALDQVMASRGAAEEKAIAQLARSTGTHWLTASGSEQFASEFQQLGHGTFTFVLLEALSGKADKGGDKKVTVKELDTYLQEVVPELTAKYKGTPQYPASYGFGNDFPIGVVKQ